MGNSQSFDITQPQKEHGGKHLQNGEANGHAISASDSLDAVSCEVSVQQNSEPPVVAQTNNTKSSASVEVDVKQASAVAVSLEVSPEQQIPVENSTPAKEEAPKPAQKASLFKMFKKKNELVTPTSEDKSASVQQNSEPTAETQTNNTQSSAESVEVDAKEVSAVIVSLEVSPEQEIPAESTTPAKEEAPKPAQKPSLFKMFKKKNEPVTPASEASCEVPVQENSEPTAETHTNNTQSPAEPVEVDPKQVSAVVVPLEVSPEQQIPVESSTPAKEEAPKPTQTASFFKMFKKKNEPVTPASEVSCEVSVQQNCDPPAMTDNTKTSAEAVEVDAKEASAVVVSLEVSPEQEISVESSTSAKEEAPKPAQTASFFKLFRKKNEPVTPASEVSCEVSVQQNSEPPPVTQASNAEPSAEAVEVDAKQANAVVVSLEVSPEQQIPVESSTPAKEDAPKPAQTASFFKMFKKKNEPITPASENKGSAEEQIVPEVHTDGQMSETDENTEDADILSLPSSPDLDAEIMQATEKLSLQLIASVQMAISSEDITDSTPSTQTISLGASATDDTKLTIAESAGPVTHPKVLQKSSEAEPPSVVEEMLKTKTTIEKSKVITEVPGLTPQEPVSETVEHAVREAFCDEPLKQTYALEAIGGKTYALESIEEESWVVIDDPIQTVGSAEFMQLLCQLKSACIKTVADLTYNAVSMNVHAKERTIHITIDVCSSSASGVADTVVISTAEEQEGHYNDLSSEPPDIKGSAEPEKEPQGETLNSSAAEVAEDSTQPEETDPEENPVMNFFKTLVSPTKTTKEATAAPDASKDQSQKETPSASAPNVQELPKVPPPPPPAPPKMESKAESALKKEEAPPVEAAAAAKEQETPSKAKAKDSPFGKLFRPKSVVKEEVQPVEVQVDASKTSTLEAAAKPEPPPAPKPEEKKPEKKPSPFANLLKPKATEPKKDAPPAPVVTEAVASTKVKEEPKPAVTAAAAPAAPDNKSVGSTDNPSPSVPRKLEKRNSIQLFFKNLGQKRHSDAGVQTEAVAPEKAK
ncbi:hypothetical protein NFI96_017450 [Prochilodus magdalenae]|nr:hypothetical protein NFI96_017450 [Prochilodus magdalenae]